ncbi:glycoside hydrolase family 95 protein [Pedobacter punctiformis]|uniref:Glycoside hydrolase family 95 protein n=1 Tax=Pedobacter punctiformis TaxID=3004097 RepID=A0ABT4L942_9SPHI|nr:glycoside hydrolase family 95 protein [Pedobacter sp. HCMS5-2]MCZ4244434.1 glycoside hydrolase family 95 protein [Pedobacter sp. HCMS5-2]
MQLKSLFIVFLTFVFIGANAQQSLKLWYKKPAGIWNDALPVGNGRLGAMVFGKTGSEIIQLNEESLWAGNQTNDNNPQALAHIKEIQQLLLNGKNNEAHELATKYLLATPPNFRSYQTLGNLHLDFANTTDVKDYQRSLDLETAIAGVNYNSNGLNYKREIFASAPDNAIVVHITADKPKSLNFKVSLAREQDAAVNAVSDNTLLLSGQIMDLPSDDEGKGGMDMKFNAIVKVISNSGKTEAANNGIMITDASEVTILITAATDYNLNKLNFDRAIDSKKTCEDIIAKASAYKYETLVQRHLNDYKPIFNRVKLDLGGDDLSNLSTDVRMDNVRKGTVDKQLTSLYFQYGRYLLMGSSRFPGVLPANLQGVWNDLYQAPWKSDYHTNINIQMNYWPADVANLSETMIPFANFVDQNRVPGRVAASETYGAKGWTIHHATDIFGKTGIQSGIHWGTSPLASVWLCLNLWDHYRFTADMDYLRDKAYPVMKEAAEFVQSFLIKDKNGYLVTAPSMSPENTFILPNGQQDQITYAPTIDIELIQSLYDACLKAGKLLNDDPEFLRGLSQTLTKLPPIQISKRTGTIQEWIEDYEEAEPGHRHISHLLGLYPAEVINPSKPELFEAAKKTLERRLANGGGHTGWSRAWIINFYARLLDGEKAWQNVQALLQKSTLNNLLDNHPPFQIDGNFGGTAGIAEMLVQSQNDYIELLPAIPAAWSNGEVSGLLARGGFEIKMKWEAGKLINAEILSKKGNDCKIKYGNTTISLKTKANQTYQLNKKLKL